MLISVLLPWKSIVFFSAVECRPLSSATCILRSATQIDGVAWWEKFAHNNIIQIWPRQTLYMQIFFVYSIVWSSDRWVFHICIETGFSHRNHWRWECEHIALTHQLQLHIPHILIDTRNVDATVSPSNRYIWSNPSSYHQHWTLNNVCYWVPSAPHWPVQSIPIE